MIFAECSRAFVVVVRSPSATSTMMCIAYLNRVFQLEDDGIRAASP
ncbi:MAG: hypothetical protein ACREUL_18130 [Steroidobacteraceae bacterium]